MQADLEGQWQENKNNQFPDQHIFKWGGQRSPDVGSLKNSFEFSLECFSVKSNSAIITDVIEIFFFRPVRFGSGPHFT